MGAFVEEVVDCPAVRHDDAVVVPFVAEYLHQQAVASAAGFTLETVVGAHHFFHAGPPDEVFECGQICFPQVARVYVLGVETMAVPFGAGVHGEVFGAGVQLVILLSFGTLQATHDRHTHLSGEVRVFSVGFLSPAPARVAEDVDVGSPHGESLIAFQTAFLAEFRGFGAGFVGDCGEYIVEQVIIERGSHADGLREDGGESCTAYSVQRFVPPVVGFYAQPGDGGGGALHQ